MADVNVVFEGWDSIAQGWGDGTWGNDVGFTALTSGQGSVTVNEGSGVTVSASGIAATSAVGSVTVFDGSGQVVSVTGISVDATAGNTTETAGGGISVGVTGKGVTVELGGVLVWSAVITAQPSPAPQWTEVNTSQTPTWTEIAA